MKDFAAPKSQIIRMRASIIVVGAPYFMLSDSESSEELGSSWSSMSVPSTIIIAKIRWFLVASPCHCLLYLSMTASLNDVGCLDDLRFHHAVGNGWQIGEAKSPHCRDC